MCFIVCIFSIDEDPSECTTILLNVHFFLNRGLRRARVYCFNIPFFSGELVESGWEAGGELAANWCGGADAMGNSWLGSKSLFGDEVSIGSSWTIGGSWTFGIGSSSVSGSI